MTTIKVEVRADHLERVVQRYKPIQAVAELIWNALDGDAHRVFVRVEENGLGGVEMIRVEDDGHGIAHEEALRAFRSLGDSQKKNRRTSPGGRQFHGEKGEGRFAAFALGGHVRWSTRWRDGKQVKGYEIVGRGDALATVEIGEPGQVRARRVHTGTTVEISNLAKGTQGLVVGDAALRFAEVFAVYLRHYQDQGIEIHWNDELIDPTQVQEQVADYPVEGVTTEAGEPVAAELTVIEWKHKVSRELILCDRGGCALATRNSGTVPGRGFRFTAYLKSDLFRTHQSILDMDELHPDLTRLIERAREVMRDHFRKRSADQASELVEQWKKDNVYPYTGAAVDPVEMVERQVFDVVALNVNEYLPSFAAADARAKRFSLQMLRSALEQSPSDVGRIVQEVLDLPKEKRDELVELLNRTSLSSIISASRLVMNRLDFLAGLEVILFDHEVKQKTKERKELHRLLAENVWVFGEEFHLAVDDQSLTEVLRKHEKLLGRDPVQGRAPVTRLDGSAGIVDLMLAKQMPLSGGEFEHLVVELKRPSVKIDSKVLSQIKSYAFAVAEDERFKSSKVRWVFWALANDMDTFVRRETAQAERPRGLAFRDNNITIWAKTWGEVLDECKGRLRFFKDKLGNMVSHESGVDYLRKVHASYLPDILKTRDKAS